MTNQAYGEAVDLDARFERSAQKLAETQEEERAVGARWQRIAALAIPLAVLAATMGAITALEVRRGPDWQHELNDYIIESTSPSERVTIQSVTEASEPRNFSPEMGTAVRDDWRWHEVAPSFPAQAVKCALLERRTGATSSDGGRATRQVVFVAYHTDALYRVGWLAYAGPEAPFAEAFVERMATIGCDLDWE